MDHIRVLRARENNLRDVSVEIPKGRLTVVTGVSGSGKSSLVFDTIAAEARRELGETFPPFVRNRLPQQARPDVDALENLTAAVVIGQQRIGGNARSTVGTATDIAPLLRLLYSRVATPHVGYSPAFSFNDPSGMCPRCEGLGTVVDIDPDRLVDRDRSLDDGAIRFSTFAPGTYRWKRYVLSGLFDTTKPLRDFDAAEWDLLLHAQDLTPPHPRPGWPRTGTYLGVLPRLRRDYLAGGHSRVPERVRAELERIVTRRTCPECDGARLNAAARSATIDGIGIADCGRMELGELAAFLRTIAHPVAAPVVRAAVHRLDALVVIGLGHLNLDRATPTLSGGEAQRISLVRHLGSSLTDLTHVLDEPSAGLHPHDVDRLVALLRRLRDKGSTVLVVEHDLDVIRAADHVIEVGPGAGADGGRVIYTGDVAGLAAADTPTGRALRRRPVTRIPRSPAGELRVGAARLHNLRDVDVTFPCGVLTVVTGVAGSGKSTLVTEVLPLRYPDVLVVDQSPPRGSRRSSPASYLGVLDPIRSAFAAANGVPVALFSPNSAGACPTCGGRGTIATDLAFLEPVTTVCEACGGSRFAPEALRHRLRGRTIAEVLALTVDEAREALPEPRVRPALDRAAAVGLGYLALGQPLPTLSGGERQRLKLAAEAVDGSVVVLDEPTAGLHPSDVTRLLDVLHGLVDRGGTVVVVEHDLDVVAAADHVVELGPGAGRDGGRILFTGPPAALAEQDTPTGRHLRRALNR